MVNDNQKRALQTQLRAIARSLDKMSQWADLVSDGDDLIHYSSIGSEARDKLKAAIGEMRAAIRRLTVLLDVDLGEVSCADLIQAEAGAVWLGLYKILSPALKRYGDVDPKLSEQMDPTLHQLINAAVGIEQIFSKT